MIDPKQENEIMEDSLTGTINRLNIELSNARAEILKYERMHNDSYQDQQVMLHTLQHFTTMFVERRQEDIIKDALEYAYDCCSLDWDVIAEVVDRLAICDPALCEKEYTVSVTVPVTVSLSVRATSASEAEERAHDEIDMNGIDNYHMEYNLSYDGEFYTEEA